MALGGRGIRGALGWLPAVVLVPAGFAVAAHVAQPPEPPEVLHQLFPLDPGTTWVYAVSDHGTPSGTHTRQVLGRSSLAGLSKGLVNASRVRETWTSFPGQGPRTNDGYFAAHGDQIDQYALIPGDHRLERLDPPAKVYELLAHVGDSWTYRGKLDINDLTFTTELEERGPVTVSGHTFSGCSHFVTTIPVVVDQQPKGQEVQEEWTCPGYGPVRSSDTYAPTGLSTTEELVEFHGQAGNWYAGARPAKAPADAAGDAVTELGIDAARSNAVPDGRLGRELAWTVGQSIVSNLAPVSASDVMVTGDRTGLVSATDTADGAPHWQVQLEPPILVTPAVVGDDVLVADGSKQVRALSLDDGSTRWVRELDDVAAVSPGIGDDTVVVATQDGRLTALDLADGSVSWSRGLGGVATAAPAVDGGRVFVCDQSGTATAYDLADGHSDWSGSMANGGVLEGIAVAGGRVLVQDDSGIVYALDQDDGDVQWQSRTRGTGYGHLAVTGDYVATLLTTTDLSVLDATSGSRLWRAHVPTTRVAPVIIGDELLTVSAVGGVRVFDLATGGVTDAWQLPSPTTGQRPRVDVPLAVVGDAVVISSTPGTAPAPDTLYAYPLHGPGAGLLLGLDPHPVSAAPTGPITAADGDLYVPGFDGAVTRNQPDGSATVVVQNEERIATAPVAAGDLLVVRKDDRLLAVPADGGDPVWSVPAGNAYGGSTPLVLAGTVYAGSADGKLLAVSLTDGSVRWSAPTSSTYLPTTPAALPDGDIVYGVGLARYDATTGHPIWAHPDVFSYGAPVVSGGTVFAAVDREGDTSGFGAWDAETGALLWFVPGFPTLYVGPSVADGVAVFADRFGTVHALDVADGAPKWALPLARPVGGTPVLRDGRAYLAALGRPEDSDQRDYRVLVVDLQTGGFLASWQPPLTGFWTVPFVSPGEEDALLVPTGQDLHDVVMGVRPDG